MRTAELSRHTYETDINIKMDLDGCGKYVIDTGIGFFNHMLSMVAKHGMVDLDVQAKGDLDVDFHHTVEDTGIVMGKCIKNALGDKKNVKRYGTFFIPMDESLSMVSVDLSGRPYLVFDADFKTEKVGKMDSQLVEEFFRALAFNAEMTLHVKIFYGKNTHHMIEGIFKAFGHAFREAASIDDSINGVMSTKGSI
ncbi:imidazoleglycerol-phosphate dehydratase HisB [Clostridium luticellarii]|jgi:imidazoleglycerol-phosphate dehydratase|uniref:Imidazoleglycerol-phosphate dehydratase n=1 Tax=Clostridium luticellarii TaxID=1691940 RepID=A0A2T0BRJ1_9CLOT|nr:imidazoleglycerol-phosphate dehydratase HisB [Clostridium luticellarii]MCI1943796.1 imidazoleglycerol-phosphate dehydratase HisB [Clostridium luticellarii]MCI1967057.1 imidazoleglycerol-phosphate dehydratase HisB [Clostridium luticellarii]MCI1994424.1 imidazoleglycerol-phosphate dehydratase HisB [Clostridium luticellarii]MCI2038623.1 imidazoleglycerol-phosphate dehydratase HisB [Clostridium luticellarii]PRR86497.1 Imidazoleglycerol-phosphate dehydratase [Clostridium luticellarii]